MVQINVNISDRLKLVKQIIQAGFQGNPGHVQNAFKQWAVRYRSEMQLRFNTLSRGGGEWPPLKRSTVLARASKPIGRLKKAFERGDIDEATFTRRMKSTKAKVKRERLKFASFSQRQKSLSKAMAVKKNALADVRSRYMAGKMSDAQLDKRVNSIVSRANKAKKNATIGGTVSILRDTGLLFNTLDPTFINAPGQLERNLGNGIEVGIGGPASHGLGPATIGDIASYHQTGAGNLPVREIIVSPSEAVQVKMAGDLERGFQKIIRESR